MNTTHNLRRGIVGLATTLLVSGGLGLAGLGLGAGTAQAAAGPYTWCPGQVWPSPDDAAVRNAWNGEKDEITWDWNVCHSFYIMAAPGNVGAPAIWEGNDPPSTPPKSPGCIGLFPLPGEDPSHCFI